MKNIKKLYFKKNKGVAMISVMITIAFISIIATTLLVISSKNYSMKTSNVLSKQNLYSVDGDLVRVSTTFKNASIGTSTPNPQTVMKGYLKDPTTTSTTSEYDVTKIIKAVYNPTNDTTINSKIHVDSANDAYFQDTVGNKTETIHFLSENPVWKTEPVKKDDGTAIPGVTRYRIQNFTITHTTSYNIDNDGNPDNDKAYYNSAKTDIIFDVYETSASTPGGGGGVGNMSLLLDSDLKSGENFSFATFTGNTFLCDYAKDNGHNKVVEFDKSEGGYFTVPGGAAIDLNKGSRVNLVGDYNICYGDIKLTGGSCLAVYGNMTVYGDIYISDNSVFICTGKLYFMEDAFPRYNTVDGSSTRTSKIRYSSGASATTNIYPSDLASNVKKVKLKDFKNFLTLLNYDDDDYSNDGLQKKILRKASFFGDNEDYVINHKFNAVEHTGSAPTGLYYDDGGLNIRVHRTTAEYNGKKIGFGYLGNDMDTINKGVSNMLLMVSRDPNGWNNGALNVKNNIPNTTIISNVEVLAGVQHGVIVSKIGTDEFNYITGIKGKKYTGSNRVQAAESDSSIEAYPSYPDSPFNSISLNFKSIGNFPGTSYDHKKLENFAVGEFFDPNCNLYVDQAYGYATSGASNDSKVYSGRVYFDNYQRNAYVGP